MNTIIRDGEGVDVSKGYASLYVLLHNKSCLGKTITIKQKDIDSTCFKNPETISELTTTLTAVHPKVFHHNTSPIHEKLIEGKYLRFFVKKGYKYELHVDCTLATKSCITFDENKEEHFQQFF